MAELTDTEKRIIKRLGKERVATANELAQRQHVSIKTVRRALAKAAYYSSINANSTYVTLQETPRFDEQGLWCYQKKICFSRHGTLQATLQALIEQSRQGRSVQELEQLVKTRVANHLSQLLRQGHIQQFYCGRHAIYAAADRQRFQQQRQRRLEPIASPRPADLPEGADPVTVIRLLVRMLEKPEDSVASLSKSLQARGVTIDAPQIRHILDFYGLKKTKPGKSPN